MNSTATFHKVRLDASWSTSPIAFYDPPPPEPGIDTDPEPPVYPEPNGYALLDTLRTRQDQGRCVPCGSAAHRSQECPLIADKLFARCPDCGEPPTARRCVCAETRGLLFAR